MRHNLERLSSLETDPLLRVGSRPVFVGIILSIELSLAATIFQHAGKLILPFETIWWIKALAQPDLLIRIFLTFLVSVLLFCGRDLLQVIRSQSGSKHSRIVDFLLLLIHCGLFVGVVATSRFVDLQYFGSSLSPEFNASIWLVCFLGVIGTALAILMPCFCWLAFTRKNKMSILMAIIVGVSAWGSGFFALRLWRFLGPSTLFVVDFVLTSLGWQTTCYADEFVIGIDSFAVFVAPSCSGYEGFGLMLSFTSGYLWVCRDTLKFPISFLLIPAATVLVWLANSMRIAVLIVIGSKGYPDVAVGGFHSQAGWIAFNLIALSMVYLCNASPYFAKRIGQPAEGNILRPSGEAVPYLLPFLSLLLVAMLSGAVTSGFDWFYPARVIVAGGLLLNFRKIYPTFRVSIAGVSMGIVVFFVWVALEYTQSPKGPPDELLLLSPLSRYIWLFFRAFGFCIVIPWAEELAFRGYLLRRLISENVTSVSVGTYSLVSLVVSSLLFGLLHGQWVGGIFAGAAYAFVLYYRRSLADSVTAHAVTNTLLMIYAVCSGKWGIWL